MHLEKSKPDDKWQFKLDGVIEMHISTFQRTHILTDKLDNINKLNPKELKEMIKEDTIITDPSLILDLSAA